MEKVWYERDSKRCTNIFVWIAMIFYGVAVCLMITAVGNWMAQDMLLKNLQMAGAFSLAGWGCSIVAGFFMGNELPVIIEPAEELSNEQRNRISRVLETLDER